MPHDVKYKTKAAKEAYMKKMKKDKQKKHSFGDYLTYMKKNKGKGISFKEYKKMDHGKEK